MQLLIGLKNAGFLGWIFVPLKEKLKKSKLQSKCHKIRTDWQCYGKHSDPPPTLRGDTPLTPTALGDMPVACPVSAYFQKFSIYLKTFWEPWVNLYYTWYLYDFSFNWSQKCRILGWIFVPLKEKLKKSKLQSICHNIRTDWQCHGKKCYQDIYFFLVLCYNFIPR
jgi:hypothetical protein